MRLSGLIELTDRATLQAWFEPIDQEEVELEEVPIWRRARGKKDEVEVSPSRGIQIGSETRKQIQDFAYMKIEAWSWHVEEGYLLDLLSILAELLFPNPSSARLSLISPASSSSPPQRLDNESNRLTLSTPVPSPPDPTLPRPS